MNDLRKIRGAMKGSRRASARAVKGGGEQLLSTSRALIERRRSGPPEPGAQSFVAAVDSFAIAESERIGIVGASGAGKSTILDFFALILWPRSLGTFELADRDGDVCDVAPLLRGQQSDRLAQLRARNISYITQSGALLPYVSVGGNALLAAKLAGRSARDADERLSMFSEKLGLSGFLARRPSTLSGGQRQRAAILRSLTAGSQIILADEPTANLDRANAEGVVDLFCAIADSTGAAVICASHDLELLRSRGFTLYFIATEISKDGTLRTARLSNEAAR